MARLLIVEDEPNAREALGEVFSGEHEVVLASDVAEALAALDPLPDLVLTDVVLPGDQDGLDLLRTLGERDPRLPVVVITAYASVEKAVRAMRDGAYDFLEKPLDLKPGRKGRLVCRQNRQGISFDRGKQSKRCQDHQAGGAGRLRHGGAMVR